MTYRRIVKDLGTIQLAYYGASMARLTFTDVDREIKGINATLESYGSDCALVALKENGHTVVNVVVSGTGNKLRTLVAGSARECMHQVLAFRDRELINCLQAQLYAVRAELREVKDQLADARLLLRLYEPLDGQS